jgi:hypothetical protein
MERPRVDARARHEKGASVQQPDTPKIPKRTRVAPNLYRNRSGRFEDLRRDPATGKQHLTTLKARTLTEAKREQRALAVKFDRGEAVAPSKLKFEQVVEEDFAILRSQVAAGERSERTLERYEGDLQRHILPALARIEIQKISARVIADLLNAKREEGLFPVE